MTPPVAGADMRAHLRTALAASCLRGALPSPVERAVCLVRAICERPSWAGRAGSRLHFAQTIDWELDSGRILASVNPLKYDKPSTWARLYTDTNNACSSSTSTGHEVYIYYMFAAPHGAQDESLVAGPPINSRNTHRSQQKKAPNRYRTSRRARVGARGMTTCARS